MIIKERDGTLVDVFAVYSFGEDNYCLGMPKGYGGLLVYKINEIEIIDPLLTGCYIYFKNIASGVYHHSLIEESLLDDILERDEASYLRFLSILKSENLISQDFR